MLKKYFVIFIVALSFNNNSYPQTTLTGHWEGALTRDGSVQLLDLNFYQNGDSIEVMYDDPAIGFYNCYLDDYEPGQKIGLKDTTFSLDFGYGKFAMYLNRADQEITGINKDWKPEVRVHLKRQGVKQKFEFDSEDIFIKNNRETLGATIYKPRTNIPCPYIILIHGSGESGIVTRRTGSYRSLAYILAQSGIGVIFYDKRGSGQSTGNNAAYATIFQLADDAVVVGKYLRSRKDIKMSKFGAMGISQGGWVATIAMNKLKIDFLILNVGPAVSIYQQEYDRIQYSMKQDGFEQKVIDSAIHHIQLYFNSVENNTGWESLHESIVEIKKTSWASSYLSEIPQIMNDEDMQWWRNSKYDPKSDLSKIKVPTLSIFCELDRDVVTSANKDLMDSYLKKAGCAYKIIVFPKAEHSGLTFQRLKGKKWDWPDKYWIWTKRAPRFYEEIIEWIKMK